MGIERHPLLSPLRVKALMIGDGTGQVQDGCVQRELPGFVGAQLVPDCLFNLHRHTPGSDEFGAHFGEIAANVASLHLSQRGSEISCFDERGLSPLRNGLIKHQMPDVAQEAFDEEPFAVIDATRFGYLSGQ